MPEDGAGVGQRHARDLLCVWWHAGTTKSPLLRERQSVESVGRKHAGASTHYGASTATQSALLHCCTAHADTTTIY
jgi:hypothetical protein